jgi:uncharacterized oxidoreductase
MSETLYFEWESLTQAAHDLARATGSPEQEAELLAQRLIKANLTGHDSHGVIRMARARPEFLLDNGSTAVLTGNRGYGQVAADHATTVAIERASQYGIAGVGVTDLAHVGRLADYAIRAAEAGMIGMVFTSTGGFSALVAPFGGKSRRMATNPMAVAFPSDREQPIVFDMATSAYAEGKFRVMVDGGHEAPEGLLIDKEGRPTTDPADLYGGGAILTVGAKLGYKGYLLNFMVEALSGLLTGGGYIGRDKEPIFNNCTMMIVINVERFRDLPEFKRELEALVGYLKDSPSLPGEEVLYPGEPEARREAERRRTGIPLAGKTVENLQAELDRYGVSTQLLELAKAAPTPQPG